MLCFYTLHFVLFIYLFIFEEFRKFDRRPALLCVSFMLPQRHGSDNARISYILVAVNLWFHLCYITLKSIPKIFESRRVSILIQSMHDGMECIYSKYILFTLIYEGDKNDCIRFYVYINIWLIHCGGEVRITIGVKDRNLKLHVIEKKINFYTVFP